MNHWLWRCRPASMVTVLAIASLGGCQHFGLPFKAEAAVTASAPSGSKLRPHQMADMQVAVARSLEKQGETAQAIAAYTEAVRLDPSRADACLRLAILYDQQGKFKESLPLYQKALAAYPGNPDIYCDMGYSLYLQRRFAEAEINLRQALALAANHPRAHNNLGLVLAHTDRWEEALAEFRQAGCTEADAQTNLAFALTLENNWPEAGRRYEMALAVDASSTAARKGLRELDAVVAKANCVRQAGAARAALPAAELAKPSLMPPPARNQETNAAVSLETNEAAGQKSDSPRGGQAD